MTKSPIIIADRIELFVANARGAYLAPVKRPTYSSSERSHPGGMR